jgi:cytochrome o ubiquinol oxidase operon protein cyoD
MSRAKTLIASHEIEQGSYRSYIAGFVLSLILTITSYLLTVHHVISGKWVLAIVVAGLALTQCIIQLTLFLHLGQEAKPKLRLLVFSFMLTVVLILVGGSIWIMHNLNNRQETPAYINNYMQQQDDGGL